MLKVGLTGSIAVGKSFVCDCFRELGCRVLDSDETARKVVAKNSRGLAEVVEHFGTGILTADGRLDRKKMAAIVFADNKKRLLLNAIIHPRVFHAQDSWLRRQEHVDPGGIAIIDAALMIESGGYKRFDKLIVVWCKPDIQLKRLMLRDDLSETEARLRIGSQMPQEEKKRYADFLIDTSDGFESTRESVAAVFRRLRSVAI